MSLARGLVADSRPANGRENLGPGKEFATMQFTITKDRDGYRARLYASNGQLVWWTEGYVAKSSAQNAIAIAQSTNTRTPVYDRT
jgi:uncharacterized protein YegP (UPF0339 family)